MSTSEYLQRLKKMLPGFDFIKSKKGEISQEKICFDTDSIHSSVFLIDEFSNDWFEKLQRYPETDFVTELKESLKNINCLAVFLGFVYERILNQE